MEDLKQIFEFYYEDLIRYAVWMDTKRRETHLELEELHQHYIDTNLTTKTKHND